MIGLQKFYAETREEETIRDGSPSPSALRVAALRALHQSVDAPVVFVDPLAVRILGPDSAALLEPYKTTAAETARLRGTLAARHVVAEEIVTDAVARGICQCVVVGAGLDTFAFRHRHAGLAVFELDHPATQAWKRSLLHGSGIEVPCSTRFVPVDLERDDLVAGLAGAGFDRGRPAVFMVLGVVAYLARATMLRLLAEIASCAAAELVLDYTEPFENAPAPIRAAYEAVAARLAAGGEPWITLFETAALHQALSAAGFVEIRDLDAAALTRRFCTGRTDGLTIAALVHLLSARTGPADAECDPAIDSTVKS